MIYRIFGMFGQAFSVGWDFIVDLVEASGMTKAVFIGLIVSLNVLVIVFGTLRARAFSGGDKAEDIDPEELYESRVAAATERIRINRDARQRYNMELGHKSDALTYRGHDRK